MSTTFDGRRVSYRAAELAEMTGLQVPHIYRLVNNGVIPRLPNCGKAVLIPAWAVRSWGETGEWRHPDYTPTNKKTPAADTARA